MAISFSFLIYNILPVIRQRYQTETAVTVSLSTKMLHVTQYDISLKWPSSLLIYKHASISPLKRCQTGESFTLLHQNQAAVPNREASKTQKQSLWLGMKIRRTYTHVTAYPSSRSRNSLWSTGRLLHFFKLLLVMVVFIDVPIVFIDVLITFNIREYTI